MTNTAEINEIRDRIHNRRKSFRIEIGRDLIAAKKLLGHGRFGDWVKSNFNWSESAANNFMNAARLADKSPEFGVLRSSALVALAAPNTPEEVRAEVANDIAQGKVPSHKEVKARIKVAKPQIRPNKTNNDSATVVSLPTGGVAKRTDAPSEQDLVRLLQAAGLRIATAAFHKAFPSAVVMEHDDFAGLEAA
jgi:hypothetical protein